MSHGAYPFDDKSIMIRDGLHQYVAFYEKLWKMVSDRGNTSSLFYSDFYGLFAYYLASPFSILILIMRMFMNINEAVTIAVIIKIGLSGVTFAGYLSKRSRICRELIIALGCMYALSDYVIGYYTNLMWLDAVILLPVLAYFLEEFVLRGGWKGYFFTLLSAIIINYYTGYMLGVFSVLYFVSLAIREKSKKQRCVEFAIRTAECVGLSLFWMIPVAVSLVKTTAGKTLEGTGSFFCGNIFQILHRINFASVPITTTKEQGAVNLFCGSAVILFFILFCRNRHIHKREKQVRILLLSIYFCGFWIRPLNLFFHGFHKPVGIPNRFSFIAIFLILQIVTRSLEEMDKVQKKELMLAFAVSSVMIIVDLLCLKKRIVLFQMFTITGVILLFTRFRRYIPEKKLWKQVLALILIADMCCHAAYGISINKLAQRNKLVARSSAIEVLLKKEGGNAEYRTVLASQRVQNEELLNNLKGMSLFSSTIPANVVTTMEKLGVHVRKNTVQYKGNSELLDIIFGVKYIIAETKAMMYRTSYKKIASRDGLYLFQNDRALKSGNALEKQVIQMTLTGENVFEIHEQILASAGCNKLYDLRGICGKKIDSDKWKTSYRIKVKKGEHNYLYIPGKLAEKVLVNHVIYDSKSQNTSFLDLGYAEEDGVLIVKTSSDEHQNAILGSYPKKRLDRIAMVLKTKYNDICC